MLNIIAPKLFSNKLLNVCNYSPYEKCESIGIIVCLKVILALSETILNIGK